MHLAYFVNVTCPKCGFANEGVEDLPAPTTQDVYFRWGNCKAEIPRPIATPKPEN